MLGQVSCAERFGVSDAAVERGVKAIGNVIDTAPDYPGTIMASALCIWRLPSTKPLNGWQKSI